MTETDKSPEDRPNIVEQLTDPETGRPKAQGGVPMQGSMLNALDSDDIEALKADPKNLDGRVDVGSDESFPASDPPGIGQRGSDRDPPPGGKFE